MRFSPSTLGWFPDFIDYPDLPDDVVAVDDALYAQLLGKQIEAGPDGQPREYVPPPPSVESQVTALTTAVQAAMDEQARTLGYDDIKTAITYLGDPNPKFAGEAEAFFAWRSAVWTQAYAHLALVQAGQAPMPTVEEAVAMMPALELP